MDGLNSTVDNIFAESTTIGSSSSLTVNELSNHDAQSPVIDNTVPANNRLPSYHKSRQKNETIIEFKLSLKNKTWEYIYKNNDINNKFQLLLRLF